MDSLILEKDNSENQARQYSNHKHVAKIEWWANRKKKKKKITRRISCGALIYIYKQVVLLLCDAILFMLTCWWQVKTYMEMYRQHCFVEVKLLI